jgi:hypothetical protein
MIAPSAPARELGGATGIAEAEIVGASASAQAANPINRQRFIGRSLHCCRVIAAGGKSQERGKFPSSPNRNKLEGSIFLVPGLDEECAMPI